MRIWLLALALVSLVSFVLAWDEKDYELFDLASAIEQYEGKGTTFYSWLEVPATASTAEISRAYRKKSIEMHPDKNPGVADIGARFARLGVIAQILRSERRERYDFFYKNGFPKWRGTGYYYARFRPGLGTTLLFLVLVTSILQNVVHRMNYKRDLARIEKFVVAARRAAWGPKGVKIEGRRRVKVNVGGNGAAVNEEGDEVSNGRSLDMVVEGDAVYIVESDGTLIPLDASAANAPSWRRTWAVALVSSLVTRVFPNKEAGGGNVEETDDTAEVSTDSDADRSRNASGYATPTGANLAGRAPAVKAGGRRRKATRK